MGREQDWRNLGDQILNTVADALNTGDFRELNHLVSGTVNDVLKDAKEQADLERSAREEAIRQYQQRNAANYEKMRQQQEELRRRQEERREEWRRMREAQMDRRKTREMAADRQETGEAAPQAVADSPRPPKVAKVKFNAVGSVANVLNTVFGGLGLGAGFGLLLVAIVLYFLKFSLFRPFFIFSVLAGVLSAFLLAKGAKQRGLVKRAQRYIQLCGDRKYANVDELAAQTGQSVKFVKKDIKKMLRKGMFPEGHLDVQETCFMLSDEVYRQYTETSAAYQMRDQMEADRKTRERASADGRERSAAEEQKNELDTMVAEGAEYVRKLHELNDAIPGEEVSTQLSALESLLRQIFERVKDHPEQMHRMHKLMDYYLPTTVKLVEAYVQFEKVETPGKDIQGAKSEILKTLGIINEAFTELLNNLFQDEVFDATTDAQVLQTMLSREGLRKEMDPVHSADEEEEQGDGQEDAVPFSFTMEPEQPQVQSGLRAPWES